jgi:hypothetical protein
VISSRPQILVTLLVPAALFGVTTVQGEPQGPPRGDGDDATASEAAMVGTLPLRIERGEGQLPLLVPRKEELVYEVHVEWGVIGAALGTVTMSATVEPYRGSLLLGGTNESAEKRETACMKAHAYGEHLLYTLDATLEARHQPQQWPHLVYNSTQSGTEERRREVLVGLKDGRMQSSYRRDTDTGAPRGTRIWKEPVFRDVPAEALDMTSAVYLVRSFIRSGLETTTFPVLEKENLWEIGLSLGTRAVQETPAGRFDAVQVLLNASHYPGEPESDEKGKFSGLFGLKGTIQLWVDRRTGIPVRIRGEVPAGPITLDADIVLSGFAGTPSAFSPLRKSP